MEDIVVVKASKANEVAGTAGEIVDIRKIEDYSLTAILLSKSKVNFPSSGQDSFRC